VLLQGDVKPSNNKSTESFHKNFSTPPLQEWARAAIEGLLKMASRCANATTKPT
jgi:hypothetical protein